MKKARPQPGSQSGRRGLYGKKGGGGRVGAHLAAEAEGRQQLPISEVLRRRDLWDRVPASIRAHLGTGAAESPRLDTEPQTVILVNGAVVCEAMAAEARAAGVAAHVVSTELEGEASFVGRRLAELDEHARLRFGDDRRPAGVSQRRTTS